MTYEKKVRVDEKGMIQKDSLADLTSQDWNDWVNDQLHQRGKVSAFVEGESPESLFLELVPYLDFSQRFKAYEGTLQCLDRAYDTHKKHTPEKDWSDILLDDLLSLVGGIETKWEGDNCHNQDVYFGIRSDAITRFLDIVESKPSFTLFEKSRDLYFRTLQALCGTEAKLPYEFWLKHLEKSPGVYGMLCFSGAANNSPSDGIKLLSYVDWSDEEARMRIGGSLLSFYYENYRFTDIIEAIERKKLELPPEAWGVFEDAQKGAAELIQKDNNGRL